MGITGHYEAKTWRKNHHSFAKGLHLPFRDLGWKFCGGLSVVDSRRLVEVSVSSLKKGLNLSRSLERTWLASAWMFTGLKAQSVIQSVVILPSLHLQDFLRSSSWWVLWVPVCLIDVLGRGLPPLIFTQHEKTMDYVGYVFRIISHPRAPKTHHEIPLAWPHVGPQNTVMLTKVESRLQKEGVKAEMARFRKAISKNHTTGAANSRQHSPHLRMGKEMTGTFKPTKLPIAHRSTQKDAKLWCWQKCMVETWSSISTPKTSKTFSSWACPYLPLFTFCFPTKWSLSLDCWSKQDLTSLSNQQPLGAQACCWQGDLNWHHRYHHKSWPISRLDYP